MQHNSETAAGRAADERALAALDRFEIELPSWGFADTGTRFGKFPQAAAAHTLEEKFADAAQVHALAGCAPRLALHVQWDLPGGDTQPARELAARYGLRPGSIHPNLFQDLAYKYGSLANPRAPVREQALAHVRDSIRMAKELASRDVSLWLADGSNYPGSADMRARRRHLEAGLQAAHAALAPDQRLLVEYKPFEPAFYHTDIADWGMALLLARAAGPQARVLVDTGHHYPGQNIEQIVAWLLAEDMLGGFHFNDRRYADDDLTLGSIDPYQVFRIFVEIQAWERERGQPADLGYMIDQSHNLKPKIEAMLQTALRAQELWAKAARVDFAALAAHRAAERLVEAEETLQSAFWDDVRPLLREWRASRGLPAEPLAAFRSSGYAEQAAAARSHHRTAGSSYA